MSEREAYGLITGMLDRVSAAPAAPWETTLDNRADFSPLLGDLDLTADVAIAADGTISISGLSAIPLSLGAIIEIAIAELAVADPRISREEAIFRMRERADALFTDQ